MLQILIFNLADDEFRCCRHVNEEGGGLMMLDVARNTGRNMGRLGVVSGENI